MPNTSLAARCIARRGALAARPAALAMLAVLAVLAVLAESGPARAHGRAPAGASSIAPCPAAGVVAWIDTNGNGAAGTIFYKLRFTNLSGRRCTLRGYPGVSAANLSGHRIGPGATRSGRPVHTVTLNRGATASADLGIVEAGNFPPATCRPRTAAGLRIYPPNATRARFVPFPFAACTRQANLRISPVAPH